MKLAYFRRSKNSYEETVQKVVAILGDKNIPVVGSTQIDDNSTLVSFVPSKWISKIAAIDTTLTSFLPTAILVTKKGDVTSVGTVHPAILEQLTHTEAVVKIAQEVKALLMEVIHTAAGVGELKPSKIVLYATTSCPYCKMEEAWLKNKKVDFEEVLVDLNEEKAEDLVRKTGQMGVPVTEIQFEDGDSDFIVGFDKEKLSAMLV